MKTQPPHLIKTITEFHRFMNLPKPLHPMLGVIDFESVKHLPEEQPKNVILNFYSIWLKRNFNGKMKYGQQEYDFDEGLMSFFAPGQVFISEVAEPLQHSGWWLLIHPDFLWNTALAKTIKQYSFFGYAVNEALFLSEKEELIVTGILENIEREYRNNMDTFSQSIIISQVEALLNYADRFYHRQFLTRKVPHHRILEEVEFILSEYFNKNNVSISGLPTVEYIAYKLNVTPNYLSRLLNVLTGKSTQYHIQDKLIEKAKEKLSTTNLTVSEIAFELGFEHSQSFSRLFKRKTKVSPLEFRQSFN